MNLQSLNLSQIKENNAQISENELCFSEALKKFTEPFADWSNAAFIYFSANGQTVSTIGESCHCGRFNGSLPGKFVAKKHFLHEVHYEEEYLGRVVLCCSRNASNAVKTLETLINLAKNELVRLEDESALLAELSASWESLQAVYDLNADFNSFQDPKCLLAKITERTTAISSKIQSVLWLENGENLEPAAAKCIYQLKPRAKNLGIVGKVFTKKRSAIFNDISRLEIAADIEPELIGAKRLAILPLTTRLGSYGVLAVWLEIENFAFDSRTMRLLDTLALQAAMVVEIDFLNRESIQNEKLNQEIEIGSKIQQTLLSGTLPKNLNGISIAAASISSQKIDGDFYEFIEHGEDCFDLIIGDVMGKGIPAALVGAATKSSFLRAIGRLQAIEQSFRPTTEKIVTWVNKEVTPKLVQLESFVTACYTRFDLLKNEVTFVDCGHTKTIHYRFCDGAINLLEGENLPLGFSEREIYAEQTVKTAPGDILFFYSDGVTETKNPEGELFGDERLAEFVRLNAQIEPKKLISTLVEALNKFSTEDKFNDDLTCIAVSFGKTDVEKQGKGMKILLDSDLNELKRVRRFVRQAAQTLPNNPMSEEPVSQLELAVTEAFTNIVEHSYHSKTGNQVEIIVEGFADGLQVVFHHWGESFDPSKVPPPIFDGSADGGFGLFIISKCVDFVGYSTDKTNRKTIRLIKNSN